MRCRRAPKDTWRNAATSQWSHFVSSADYLRWLADNGYLLAPVEQGRGPTSVGRTQPGHALFRTEASNPDGSNARLVLEDGVMEYCE